MSALVLKIIIVIIFVLMVASLFGGLGALIKDKGEGEKQNQLLGIRAALALSLMAVLLYGIFSGKLGSNAPWDARKTQQAVEQNDSPE